LSMPCHNLPPIRSWATRLPCLQFTTEGQDVRQIESGKSPVNGPASPDRPRTTLSDDESRNRPT
jgi:hypothetical protein